MLLNFPPYRLSTVDFIQLDISISPFQSDAVMAATLGVSPVITDLALAWAAAQKGLSVNSGRLAPAINSGFVQN